MASAKSLSTMFMASLLFVIILYNIMGMEASITNNMLDTFFPSQLAPSQRWAILVAGSKGYMNYRHQADICHAWQMLTDKGVPQENIVVFMYDDVAYDVLNPFQGVLRNSGSKDGFNVYEGVTKDYVGDQVTTSNLIWAFLGVDSRVVKKVTSGPNDYIFFYFSGHGTRGALGMPGPNEFLTMETFKSMLRHKQNNRGFNQMLVYIEACHSGSMIEFLDNTWRIYATAASTSEENSYAVYCDVEPYTTCLGDGYSVAWMEDSDADDITLETVGTQFDRVMARVLTQKTISHVVEYGLMDIKGSMLSVFQGPEGKYLPRKKETSARATTEYKTMSQDEVEVWYLKGMVRRAKMGSVEREEAQKQLDDVISHRKHVDQSVIAIVRAIVNGQSSEANATTSSQLLNGSTKAYTWDWKCLKEMVASYQAQCGTLRSYGMNYNHVFANLCDFGISPKQLGVAARQICLPHLVKPQWMAEDKVGFYNNPYV